MKTKAIKNLKEKVEAVLKDYPQSRDSDVWLTLKIWSLYYPTLISRGGFLMNFRDHIAETLGKRALVKPDNFGFAEWELYKSQTQVWKNMLDEFDNTLLKGGYVAQVEEKIVPVAMVELKNIMDLPREDNVKRIRAKFQNEEKKYLPTTLEVARQRKISEEEWRAWSKNQDKLL